MRRVFVSGLGAVSPAGWGVAALREVLEKGAPLPVNLLDRPGWEKPLRARLVPAPQTRPLFLGHPRLRRTSPITHYAAAAALEAVARVRRDARRSCALGLVVCLQAGCVDFCYRFFDEMLKDPATASPLIFPETVFAAPASHVAAVLENAPLACTLTGDPACFLQGMALAIQWLCEERVEACLVVGSEEVDWLLADALWHFNHESIASAGAGALCLSLDPEASVGVELESITDAHTYTTHSARARAVQLMRKQLPSGSPTEILCDSLNGNRRADSAEMEPWQNWGGSRLSLKPILGDGLIAGGAWQCVAACDAVANGRYAAASVSLAGNSQQAIGARFVRSDVSGTREGMVSARS